MRRIQIRATSGSRPNRVCRKQKVISILERAHALEGCTVQCFAHFVHVNLQRAF